MQLKLRFTLFKSSCGFSPQIRELSVQLKPIDHILLSERHAFYLTPSVHLEEVVIISLVQANHIVKQHLVHCERVEIRIKLEEVVPDACESMLHREEAISNHYKQEVINLECSIHSIWYLLSNP